MPVKRPAKPPKGIDYVSPDLRPLVVRCDALTADPANVRLHSDRQLQHLRKSLEKFGQRRPITVNADGTIEAGNATYQATVDLGREYIAVVLENDDPQTAAAWAIADNRLAELAEWDWAGLSEQLHDFVDDGFDLEIIGFDEHEAADIMASDLAGGPAIDPYEPPPDPGGPITPPTNPITRNGDVWQIGRHRLVCGDCRDVGVARAVSGGTVAMAFTSPPYASQRAYDSGSGFTPIPPSEYVNWFRPVSAAVRDVLAPDGSWFINIKPSASGIDTSLYVMDLIIAHVREWGWHFATEFCWERVGVPNRVTQRFKNQFEPIYQMVIGRWKMNPDAVRHRSAAVPKAIGKGAGNTNWGDIAGSNVQGTGAAILPAAEPGLAYPGNRLPPFQGSADGHPAAFPVGLPDFFARAFTDPGDLVLDPFAGSGSTLLACEGADRRCASVELSPGYCDIIVQRWEEATGGKATRRSA